MSYVTGFLTPVKVKDKERYIKSAEVAWPIFKGYGCLEHVEAWGEDVPDGVHTSFPMAVKKEEDEVVVFAWLRWPDRQTADAAWAKMMEDPAMKDMDMPFDGKRMMWGGFQAVFEQRA